MTHFGLISLPVAGHLNPMTALGYELKRRGHRVSLVGIPECKAKAELIGLEFLAIGEKQFPIGSLTEKLSRLGKLRGLAAMQYTFDLCKEELSVMFDETPKVIQKAGIEVLVVDQCSLGSHLAEFLDLPYITVCNAMINNSEVSVPPYYTQWRYSNTWLFRLRNQIGYTVRNLIAKPYKKMLGQYRQKLNLPVRSKSNNYFPLAVVCQQPPEFEFPRQKLPQWFHFTGPFYPENPNHYSRTREPVPFPWEKLTGQPLIYAAMGTLQNRLVDVFEKIATACEGLDVQLVMSLGGGLMSEELPQLPGNPIVVSYAPQLELLQKATLTITHAGLNTTLESLSNGVSMVAIPITNDQPGVAARILWTGVGEAIPLKRLNVDRLRQAVTKVLTEDSYKQNALRLQEAIKRAGGGTRAADIIEQAVATGKPVLSGQF